MGRASRRASVELRRSAELAKLDCNTSRSNNTITPTSQNIRFSAAVELRRQRSVLQAKEPGIAAAVLTPNKHSFGDLSSYIVSPPSEFSLPEGCRSEPSSYRRLRKAKSLLTPRKRAMSAQHQASCSPSPTQTVLNMNDQPRNAENGLSIGLRRSISFLKSNGGSITKTFKRGECQQKQNDAAVQLAQNQFGYDLEQQKLHQKPSFIFSTTARRPQKAFRKTVRSSRTTEFGDGVKSDTQPSPQDKPESKIRSFSATWRDKVKRVFGKSLAKKGKIPTQQLDASRPHFRDYVEGC